MQLSTRLAAIAQFVPKQSHVIDVGTDHAYIPIYLVEQGIALSCLATDINKGPLEKAKKNLVAHQLEQKIKLMQTNGVEGVTADQGEVLMISGMGGYLIIDILQRGHELVRKMKKLILQPQQDIVEVRKYLHQIGFRIEAEAFVEDDEKYYTVISAVPGKECYEKAYEYAYGKCLIEQKNEVLKEWVEMKLAKQEGIYQSLFKQDSEGAKRRQNELREEIAVLREVEKCLS